MMDDVDDVTRPTLTLAGREFVCVPAEMPRGSLMLVVEAEEAGDVAGALAAQTRLLRRLVAPQDHQSLFDALDEAGRGDIEDAVGDVIAAYLRRPTVRPSPAQPGPPPIEATSRVVSLWPESEAAAETG